MRYLLHLAYNGTAYHGWQRQKNTAQTVQELIEKQLSLFTRESISVLGCGRTDKGVHAQQFFCHFDLDGSAYNLVYKLNRMLPKDIVVYDILPVDARFNARFAATERTYRYFFHNQPDPFLSKLSSYYHLPEFSNDKFQTAVRLLPKYKEYRAFCKTPDKVDHTLCTVSDTVIYKHPEEGHYCFEITANRFLRGMIRVLMHSLLAIAKGEQSIADFEEMLKTGVNPEEIKYAYPQGLYLHRVTYPGIEIEPDGELTRFLWEGMEQLT